MINNKIKLPSLNCVNIYSAVHEVAEKFELYGLTLDQISADIKALERYFQQKKINFPFSFKIQDSFESRTAEDDAFSRIWEHGDSTEEFLLWEKDKSESFRLMYRKIIYRDRALVDGCIEHLGAVEELEFRPLIESKIDVRAKAHGALPDMVKAFAQQLPQPTEAGLLSFGLDMN